MRAFARVRTGLRVVIGALASLWLIGPAPADETLPKDKPKPPICAGRDLSANVDPGALAHAREQRRDALDNAQGLLWRIEKAPAPPSYLFGTIHSTDDRAIAIAKNAGAHIAGAKVVATELGGPFDTFALAAMGASMMVKALARDSDPLAGLGSPEDIARVEKFLAARGVEATMAHHLRIWFLAAMTAAPPCEIKRQQLGLPVVDEWIAQTAKDQGVKVVGLETVGEQTDLLASLDPAVAASVLVSTARRPEASDDAYATLLSLYAEQRPGEIFPVADAAHLMTPQESAAEDEMTSHLLGGRNKAMVERMSPLLDAGGAFVAVGALHLVGKGGLIALLRAAGFTATAVQ
jgi:uncharacterized protein YbaP (TraB family)